MEVFISDGHKFKGEWKKKFSYSSIESLCDLVDMKISA